MARSHISYLAVRGKLPCCNQPTRYWTTTRPSASSSHLLSPSSSLLFQLQPLHLNRLHPPFAPLLSVQSESARFGLPITLRFPCLSGILASVLSASTASVRASVQPPTSTISLDHFSDRLHVCRVEQLLLLFLRSPLSPVPKRHHRLRTTNLCSILSRRRSGRQALTEQHPTSSMILP